MDLIIIILLVIAAAGVAVALNARRLAAVVNGKADLDQT